MLVYANKLCLVRSRNAFNDAKRAIATWLEQKLDRRFPIDRLEGGLNYVAAGQTVRAWSHTRRVGSETPEALCVQYTHADLEVGGRDWVTEIGVLDDGENDVEVTVLLETKDHSAHVGRMPVVPTRPGIVRVIASRCQLSVNTVGGAAMTLGPQHKEQLREEVMSNSRKYCVILVSPADFTERPLVDSERIAEQLIGLAKVYVIDNKFSTLHFTKTLGPAKSAWNGAVNVIFPRHGMSSYIPTRLYRAQELGNLTTESIPFERELLGLVTHRANLKNSWAHLSPEVVQRIDTSSRIKELKAVAHSRAQDAELLSLYEEQEEDLRTQVAQLGALVEGLRSDLAQKEERVETLQQQTASLKWALSQKSNAPAVEEIEPQNRYFESLTEVAEAVETELAHAIRLTNRAVRSMEESPYEDCSAVFTAFDFLANSFYPAFKNGESLGPITEELRTLGIEYEPHLSDVTTGNFPDYNATYKKRRADFSKHLKLGVSRRPTRCFRIHFEWDYEDEKIVVHHAGKHLQGKMTRS